MHDPAVIKKFRSLGILTGLIALILDQASKHWLLALTQQDVHAATEVTPFFNIVMVWNRGVSFGMFASHEQPLLLVALSLAIIAVLLRWLSKTPYKSVALAIGLVIGGALGNVIDRLRFGAVADFFDFHIAGYHWPAFNIADSCIFIGVVVLCAHSMFIEPKTKGEPT